MIQEVLSYFNTIFNYSAFFGGTYENNPNQNGKIGWVIHWSSKVVEYDINEDIYNCTVVEYM